MTSSKRPILLILSLLAAAIATTGCVTPNPQPALQASALQKAVFTRAMDGNEALVRRSNPPPDTLAAYLAQARSDRDAYDRAFQAANAAIGSMGALDAAQVNGLIDQILPMIDRRLTPMSPPPTPATNTLLQGGGR